MYCLIAISFSFLWLVGLWLFQPLLHSRGSEFWIGLHMQKLFGCTRGTQMHRNYFVVLLLTAPKETALGGSILIFSAVHVSLSHFSSSLIRSLNPSRHRYQSSVQMQRRPAGSGEHPQPTRASKATALPSCETGHFLGRNCAGEVVFL